MNEHSLSKKILIGLLITGAIVVAASSPYFAFRLPKIVSEIFKKRKYHKGDQEKFDNAFYYLKKRGYLITEKKGKQIYISLTEQGKKRAGKYQINDLQLEKPKQWDELWRIVIFDVPDLTRVKREALRGKLKELGFQIFQKSVWVHPYNCKKEIKLLREFFGLKQSQLTLIEGNIEGDNHLRKFFNLT